MRQKHKWQTWIGVVTAFAFALQAFLAAAVSTQMAVAAPVESFAICHSIADPADSQHPPSGPTHGAYDPCTICSFASAGGLAPSLVPMAFARIGKAVIAQQPPLMRVVVGKQRSPQVPQGPPQTA